MNGHLSAPLEWFLFMSLSLTAMFFAFRMVRTMSMVRAGVYLMASFCAIAGLFLVLSADLIASMQIMMYAGGMLVMIIFMVMMSPDPGGSTMGISPAEPGVPEMDQMMKTMSGNPYAHKGTGMMKDGEQSKSKDRPDEYECPMHPDVRSPKPGKCPKCGMHLEPAKRGKKMDGMSGPMDMAMTNEFTRPAAILGTLTAAALIAAILLLQWPAAAPLMRTDSAELLGRELLGRYMIAFEGGALLIIVGVVGAVILGRREP